MGYKYLIYKRGQWRQLDLETGLIDRREKARFFYVHRGILQYISSMRVLPRLKAGKVHHGFTLPEIYRTKKSRHSIACAYHRTNTTNISPKKPLTEQSANRPSAAAPPPHPTAATPPHPVAPRPQCKEVFIDYEDMRYIKMCLRQQKGFDFDEDRFDTDDLYREAVLYKLNPLVSISAIDISHFVKDHREMTLNEFAASLGLAHKLTRPAKSSKHGYKTRGNHDYYQIARYRQESTEDQDDEEMPPPQRPTNLMLERNSRGHFVKRKVLQQVARDRKRKKSLSLRRNRNIQNSFLFEKKNIDMNNILENKRRVLLKNSINGSDGEDKRNEKEDNRKVLQNSNTRDKENNPEHKNGVKQPEGRQIMRLFANKEDSMKEQDTNNKRRALDRERNTYETSKKQDTSNKRRVLERDRNTDENTNEQDTSNKRRGLERDRIIEKSTKEQANNKQRVLERDRNIEESTKQQDRSNKRRALERDRNTIQTDESESEKSIPVKQNNHVFNKAVVRVRRIKSLDNELKKISSQKNKIRNKSLITANKENSASFDPSSVSRKSPRMKKFKIPKLQTGSSREYSDKEDIAILNWVVRARHATRVSGNTLWRELEDQYHNDTGKQRTWQSLRNRYLRSILPSLQHFHISEADKARLRAAAVTGEIKRPRRDPADNSIHRVTPVRSAALAARNRGAPNGQGLNRQGPSNRQGILNAQSTANGQRPQNGLGPPNGRILSKSVTASTEETAASTPTIKPRALRSSLPNNLAHENIPIYAKSPDRVKSPDRAKSPIRVKSPVRGKLVTPTYSEVLKAFTRRKLGEADGQIDSWSKTSSPKKSRKLYNPNNLSK